MIAKSPSSSSVSGRGSAKRPVASVASDAAADVSAMSMSTSLSERSLRSSSSRLKMRVGRRLLRER